MARRPLGSRTIAWPKAEKQHVRGRLVACTHPCGWGQQIVAISIYGVVHAGVAGNTDLLRTLFQFIHRLRHGAWIIGGDWNVTPEELMTFGLARASRGRIQSPGRQDSGECREIDYFLVGPAVHASGWAASFYDGCTLPTHEAARMTLCGRVRYPRVAAIRRPRPLVSETQMRAMRSGGTIYYAVVLGRTQSEAAMEAAAALEALPERWLAPERL